jgi:uncharacterized membrane protein
MVTMRMRRWLRHLTVTRAHLDRAFDARALAAIESAVAECEQRHSGQIRVAIEAGLDPAAVWRGHSPRDRALGLFASLGVWDTEANNGVLIYVLLADRVVEIVADRGYNGRVEGEEWLAVCRSMEARFREGRFEDGMQDGIRRVGEIMAGHFPSEPGSERRNELPDRPVLL